jgi:hypothetical protein
MKIEPAIKNVIVPMDATTWSMDQTQEWAKGILAGGPPDFPENPQDGSPVKWDQLKNWVGKKIRLRARPKGLILYSDDGSKRFIPGDTSSSQKNSRELNVTTNDMREKSKTESKIRDFVNKEIKKYNKKITKEIRETQKRTTTLEFWESGKRIRDFLKINKDLNQDQIWFALEQWGRGNYGYKHQWFRYASYFFDWQYDTIPDSPIFMLSETRIMNIIRATKNHSERNNLFEACISGPLKEFSDDQFKWITGQSQGTFPQKKANLFDEIKGFGIKISKGDVLSKEEVEQLNNLLCDLTSE